MEELRGGYIRDRSPEENRYKINEIVRWIEAQEDNQRRGLKVLDDLGLMVKEPEDPKKGMERGALEETVLKDIMMCLKAYRGRQARRTFRYWSREVTITVVPFVDLRNGSCDIRVRVYPGA